MSKWRSRCHGEGWLGMKGTGAVNGECRVVRPADKPGMTLSDLQAKLSELSAKYDSSNPDHRRQWAQLKSRIEQMEAA